MKYIIRDSCPDDIDGKAYVHWKSWQETYAGIISQSYLDQLTLEKCQNNARRWSDNIIVAEVNGSVVGFAGFGSSNDTDVATCGEVYAIYVLREYQHHKIGYALMNACLEKLSSNTKIVVWVLQKNEQAILFYRRYGFVLDGQTKELILGTPEVVVRMSYLF